MTHFDDYLIECKLPIINFNYWLNLYHDIREKKIGTNFGYGIKLNANDYAELKSVKKELPLKDNFYFLISNRIKREFPIHVDGIPGIQNASSLNWPLQNCSEESPTHWYNFDKIEYKIVDGSYFIENIENSYLVAKRVMSSHSSRPYLFRSDIPHRGFFGGDSNQFRIIVKWELNYSSWKEACDEFYNKKLI